MNKRNKTQLVRRYRAALRLYLHPPAAGETGNSESASSLGSAAASLGITVVGLVRLHGKALAGIAASVPLPTSGVGRRPARPKPQAGNFLIAALRPFEPGLRLSARNSLRVRRLERMLAERTAALLTARRRVRRELARRRIGERHLAKGARHYGRLLSSSQRLQDQSRRLARQVLLAQEEERREISRELHDEVAQILASINVQLATLKEASAIDSRSVRRKIARTQRLIERSVRIVHRFARELRPALLDDLGLIPALRSYIRDLPVRNGLRIRFTAFAGVEALDNIRRTVLYRVAQEALTNVVRHAHARIADVRLVDLPGAVRLEVRDDGRSFQADRLLASLNNKRLGLLGMRERVEMVGGSFVIESAPGVGTTVRAEIPFNGTARGATE